MNQSLLFVSLVSLSFASIVACGDGSTVVTGSGTSTSPTEPSDGGKDGSSSGSHSSSGDLGPQCTAYLACCDEVAAQVPQLGASCDSTRTSIKSAEDKGASTDSYESACSSGLSGFKNAGYCK